MNAQRLLTAFAKIGDDPDRIQQLRKIAVALAISGKLDSGAASMTPSQVLDAVNRVKAGLAKRGAIPKPKRMEDVTADQLPADFSDPARFAPLGELARIEKGLTGIQQAQPGEYSLVVTSAERSTCDHFDFDGAAAIIPLVSSTGHGNASINRLHYQEGKFALGTILVAAFPYDPALISARFLFEYLSAFKEELLVSRMTGTANVTLSVGRVAEVPVPLICPEVQRKVDDLMALCDQLEQARAGREAVRDRLTAATWARLAAPETDAETFPTHARAALQSLPTLTTRPNQIKTLRQTILNLAVRGKLVKQDPTEEPAAVQLELTDKRKRDANLKKPKALSAIGQEEMWCKLPTGWEWVRWDRITNWITYGFTRPMPHEKVGIPIVTGKNVNEGRIILNTADRTSPQAFAELNDKDKPVKGDILITKDGSIGRTAIVENDDLFCINQSVAVLWLRSCDASRKYLQMVLDSPQVQQTLLNKTAGVAIKHISIIDLGQMVFPLPPLEEQHRIVARVDTLMALCDQLESSLTTATTTRSRLLETLLHEALEPAAVGMEAVP